MKKISPIHNPAYELYDQNNHLGQPLLTLEGRQTPAYYNIKDQDGSIDTNI
jgi:hypothetical protein